MKNLDGVVRRAGVRNRIHSGGIVLVRQIARFEIDRKSVAKLEARFESDQRVGTREQRVGLVGGVARHVPLDIRFRRKDPKAFSYIQVPPRSRMRWGMPAMRVVAVNRVSVKMKVTERIDLLQRKFVRWLISFFLRQYGIEQFNFQSRLDSLMIAARDIQQPTTFTPLDELFTSSNSLLTQE